MDAGKADEHLEAERKSADDVLVDTDDHLGIDVVGIELENPLVVVFGAEGELEAGR